MSRSNYSDDLDQRDLAMWRGRVMSAIRGKRGQRLLREMLVAMDAMPNKRLIQEELIRPDGEVCALGCVAVHRGMDVSTIDAHEPDSVAAAFDIASPLAAEIAYENDEATWNETPEKRWQRMRNWVGKLVTEK